MVRPITVTPSTTCVGVQAPLSPAFDPCHVLRVGGCSSPFSPQHPRSLSAFLILFLPLPRAYAVFLGSEADGTETHAALYSDPLCPAHLPSVSHSHSKTHTHTHTHNQCFESRMLSTPSPQSNSPCAPPGLHRVLCKGTPAFCSRAQSQTSSTASLSEGWRGEQVMGAPLPCPEDHPGASMALEAQRFICIS